MSDLLVLTFEDIEQAGLAFEALEKMKAQGKLKIDDAAVIVKHDDGKVEIKNQTDSATKTGAIGGGVLGLIIAGVFFPVAGLVIGAAGGALVGKSLDKGIDKQFIKDVTDTLKPGSSALFVIGTGDGSGIVGAALRPFKGTIYQTSLPTELVDALREELRFRH
jgi:uncharacterized membrane protein